MFLEDAEILSYRYQFKCNFCKQVRICPQKFSRILACAFIGHEKRMVVTMAICLFTGMDLRR